MNHNRTAYTRQLLAMHRAERQAEEDAKAIAGAERKVSESQQQQDVNEVLAAAEKILSGIYIPKEFR